MKRFRLGYDIGGTNARLSAFGEDRAVLGTIRRGIRQDTSPEGVAGAMAQLRDELLEELGLEPEGLVAAGAGVAAQLATDARTVVNAPNLGWRDLDFGAVVQDALGHNVHLANDLNALLFGEYMAGAAVGFDDVLAVYVGTGVGGAMISAGKLVEGAGGKGGEIGHVKVVPGGRLCGCGERGCLEAYSGGKSLEAQVRELALQRGTSQVFIDGDERRVDLGVADELSESDEAFGELWERSASFLAMSVANACTLLNPGLLLLGGGVLENCARFRAQTLTRITPLVLTAARDDLRIASPNLGDVAGMLGSAWLADAA